MDMYIYKREGCGILTLYPRLVVAAFWTERDLRTHHASRSTAVPEQSREQGINAPTLSGFGVLQAFGHRRSDRAVYGNTHVRTERGEVRQVLNFPSNMSIRGAQNLSFLGLDLGGCYPDRVGIVS